MLLHPPLFPLSFSLLFLSARRPKRRALYCGRVCRVHGWKSITWITAKGREMEDAEREKERERTGATQHAPDTRECKGEESAEWRDDGGGRVVKRRVLLQEAAWWRQSRARGWEWRREPPQSRRTALSSTNALRDTFLHSLTVFSLDSFFFFSFLPSFLLPDLSPLWPVLSFLSFS